MNWSRSWSKVCDSDRIVPSPSRSASGPWCWVGRSVMFFWGRGVLIGDTSQSASGWWQPVPSGHRATAHSPS
ncbi:unnamed protein product, partial [Brassica rapa subsp. trilocularis]